MDSITKASLMDIRIPLKNIIEKEKEVEMKMDAEDTLELMSIIEGGGLLKNENPVEKLKALDKHLCHSLVVLGLKSSWTKRCACISYTTQEVSCKSPKVQAKSYVRC